MSGIEPVTVQPGTGRWHELVAEAIRRDAARNWFLGDAALEIAPWGSTGENTGALSNLRQFAAETGVEYGSLYQYRAVAAWWPPADRIEGTSWTVHRMLAAEAHRHLIRPGMTTGGARAALEDAAALAAITARVQGGASITERAEQFGRWDQHGCWVLAADVACCVQIGGDTRRKVSVAEFARLAGVPPVTVLHHLVAWELAACQGLVPPADSLTPDSDPPLPPAETEPDATLPPRALPPAEQDGT